MLFYRYNMQFKKFSFPVPQHLKSGHHSHFHGGLFSMLPKSSFPRHWQDLEKWEQSHNQATRCPSKRPIRCRGSGGWSEGCCITCSSFVAPCCHIEAVIITWVLINFDSCPSKTASNISSSILLVVTVECKRCMGNYIIWFKTRLTRLNSRAVHIPRTTSPI